jgi:hypothetical protein
MTTGPFCRAQSAAGTLVLGDNLGEETVGLKDLLEESLVAHSSSKDDAGRDDSSS